MSIRALLVFFFWANQVAAADSLPVFGKPAQQQAVQRFYQAAPKSLAWFSGDGVVTVCGEQMLWALSRVEDEGIQKGRYNAFFDLLDQLDLGTPEGLAQADQALTAAALDYISFVGSKRNHPYFVNANPYLNAPEVDPVKILQEGLASGTHTWIEHLPPQHPQYQALKKNLGRYQEVERLGGWLTLPHTLNLKPGQSAPEILILRQQLVAQGMLASAFDDGFVFDAKVQAAVKFFQRTHGLEPSGQLTSKTLAALNVPVQKRIQQIRINMERWRWLPPHLGTRYLVVNVPSFELFGMENDQQTLKMPIIVGTAYRKTPLFSAPLTGIILNPSWTVPYRIAVQDKLPLFQKNPARAAGYRILTKEGKEISPHSISWHAYSKNSFPYTLRQDPGPRNALGRMRFTLARNPFDVHLHGTPNVKLFQAERRAFSSGCIRVESPIDLALFLLQGHKKWTKTLLEQETKSTSKNTQNIFLSSPVPTYVTYMTVVVDNQGVAHFYEDIYNHDAGLIAFIRDKLKENKEFDTQKKAINGKNFTH